MFRILALARKEWLQMIRDPLTALVALILPPVMILLFGTAITLDLKQIPFAILDQDNSSRSRELRERLSASGYFQEIQRVTHPKELDQLMDQGRIRTGLWIPLGWEKSLLEGKPSPIFVLLDGSDANTARLILKAFSGFTLHLSQEGVSLPLSLEERILFNPELQSPLFYIPGLTAIVLLVTCVVLTALSLVREKERGTMEILFVTPLSPFEMILGKIIPYLGLAFIAFLLALFVGVTGFKMPVHGDLFLLFVLSLIFIAVGLSYGLFISTLAHKQEIAWMIALITTLLPSMILSGFFFPIRSMPPILQGVTYLFPARYMIAILREVILKGNNLQEILPELLPLLLFFGGIVTLATRNLQKRT